MRRYEVMLMMHPETTESQSDAKIAFYADIVKQSGGTIVDINKIGRRELAYEVQHLGEAYYAIFRYNSDGSANAELERRLRFDAEVMRFLVVRLDDEMKYAEKRERKRETIKPESGDETPQTTEETI